MKSFLCWLFMHDWWFISYVRNPLYGKQEEITLNSGETVSVNVPGSGKETNRLYKCRACGKEKIEW